MSLQLSVTARNDRLDAFEATVGASAILKLRSGLQPATCATADSGTVIASLTLPADWMEAASGGAKVKSGTWQDVSADAAGTIGHFRIYDSTGATCHLQGSVTATGGGGDLTIASLVVALGQVVTITGFTLSEANP
jgi:hypothetical protein